MIHHGWPTTKNTPKKQNLDQKIKILKIKFKNLRPGRLLNVLYTFNLRLVSTGQVQIFCQKNSNPIKTRKITHFAIQFRSKNVTHFKNLKSLKSIKNILPQHSQKHISGWCQKKKLHSTISRRPRIAFSELLESKCLYISVRTFLLQRRKKLLSGGGLNNFCQADGSLGLVKCFSNFSFELKFLEIHLYFSISILPSIVLKR